MLARRHYNLPREMDFNPLSFLRDIIIDNLLKITLWTSNTVLYGSNEVRRGRQQQIVLKWI